jgi:uncharacterized protein (DUF1778 family)
MSKDRRYDSIRVRCTDEEKEILRIGASCDERVLSDFVRFHMLKLSKKLIIEKNNLEAYNVNMTEKVLEQFGLTKEAVVMFNEEMENQKKILK